MKRAENVVKKEVVLVTKFGLSTFFFRVLLWTNKHLSMYIGPWIFQERSEAHHTSDDQEHEFTISHTAGSNANVFDFT